MHFPSESIPQAGVGGAVESPKLVRFQAALAEIMAEWQPLETTLARALESLVANMPGSAPAFLRLREGRFFCLAALPAHAALWAGMEGLRLPAGAVCHDGEAPFWSYEPRTIDVRADEAWAPLRPLLHCHGRAGCWSWPVFSPCGEALGTIALFREEARPPEADEAGLLDCAARILALLIEQRLLIDDLRYQAEHDPLTGALNSVAFPKLLEREVMAARKDSRPLSLVCLVIDQIRSVNDLLGRAVGDRLLRDFAARVSAALGSEDVLARTDGNKFVVLLRGPAQADEAFSTATQIANLVQTPFPVGGNEISLRVSAGLASFPLHAADGRSLLQAAQATVRRIRNSGRNRVEVCDPRIDHVDLNRARLESALRGAAERNELLLYYQPKIWLGTGKLDGAEALMRWRSADLGIISPTLFIPVAEETGEIVDLGRWAIHESCRQAAAWHGVPGQPQRISVNVSRIQLSQPELLSQIRTAAERWGIDPTKLELEITESSFARDYSRVLRNLRTLRDLGVQIALDDFGTGYSSLSVLRELPFDTLKIDKSFLDAAEAGSATNATVARRLLASMIDLGHDLGKNVVVEGVETQAQADLLKELDCDIVQGYLFGRPAPASDWEK